MIILLTGPNSFAITETIRHYAAKFDGEVEALDASELEVRDLPDLFIGASLFSPRRFIVLRGAGGHKPLWADLEQWIERVPEETTIVIVEPNPDKRTKTYKQLHKHATVKEHAELSEAELASWLQGYARSIGTEIPSDALRYLISYVGRDQWRLKSELDKLLLAEKPLTRELIQDIAEPYPEATAFELLDNVFKRNTSRVEELVDLLSAREDPYQFFGLLSSQVMALLALTTAGSRRPADIARDMGVHPFVASKLAPLAKELGRQRVDALIDILAHCDMRIKSSGVNPWRQLRLTMLEITTKQP